MSRALRCAAIHPLDLQHRFAAIVHSVEQQKATQRAHLAELDTLFASSAIPRLPGRPLNLDGHLRKLRVPDDRNSRTSAESARFRGAACLSAIPRASCFHARHALERLLTRVYKVEKALTPPKVTNLDGYISDPAFRALVPEVVWQKAEYVRLAGNVSGPRHQDADA